MSDSKQLSKARYTEHAAAYVTSQTHAKGADLDRLVTIAQPEAHWHVLDIATGGGHTALKFAGHVATVIASDLTPRMLEKAEAHLTAQGADNVRYQIADAEDLPFEEDLFDLVTCRIAPHHFPDAAQFVREAARVLKVGGLLLVQDHVLPDDTTTAAVVDGFEALRDPSHNHAFSQVRWEAMFVEAGLSIDHAEQLIKRHDFADWTARQACDAAIIAELTQIVATASEAVHAWMQPENWGTESASFVNHHLIIAGRKDSV